MVNRKECPICDSKKSKIFLESMDYSTSKEEFVIRECEDCNFRYTSPVPAEDRIGEYYESEEYISHSDSKKGIMNKVYHVVRNRAIKKKEKLIASFGSGKHLMDIGCGTGDFLKYCQEKGWDCSGLEPDQGARSICAEKGVKVYNIDRLHEVRKESLSVITMWHVLEHVYHLKRDFEKICSSLTNNGRLIIAVPNCSSYDAQKYGKYWAAYDLPIHLYHFRPADMKRLAIAHDMVVEQIIPMKYDSFYVSMLSEKYKGGNLINAFFNGWRSNLKANRKSNTYSSQIYVLAKKTSS